MLAAYRGDGRRYHLNFAKVGFAPQDADRVSFIELLHVPTVGRNYLQARDLEPAHLDALNALITSGKRRHVFLSSRVSVLMRESRHFPWLIRNPSASGPLPVLHRIGQTAVYRHLHFSNYGKFQERMSQEAAAIAVLAKQGASMKTLGEHDDESLRLR